MGRRREETQLELGLTRRVCWRELPEASQAQVIELLTQLLRLVAQVRPNNVEASDERWSQDRFATSDPAGNSLCTPIDARPGPPSS